MLSYMKIVYIPFILLSKNWFILASKSRKEDFQDDDEEDLE